MCRFVILAVIAASLVSCVLADTPPITNKTNTTVPTSPPVSSTTPKSNATKCANTTEMIERRRLLMECFDSVVQFHLNSAAPLLNENCTTATVFGQQLDAYLAELKRVCNYSVTFNTTNFIKVVEYSLSNNSFKTFYENITCLKELELNISNDCVKNELGFFNITKTEKHGKWFRKGQLTYDKNTCGNSKLVKDCVTVTLQECPLTTTKYVVSLFEYARSLGNCSQYPDIVPTAPFKGNAEESTWLTTPVIATLSVGAVVVVGAIIAIIVIKHK